MFVVAITWLAGDLEASAGPLASLLGLAAYDIRTRVGGVLPAVVAQSPSAEEATRALEGVRALGHRALMCDTREVIATHGMVDVHRFRLDERSVYANDGDADRMSFDDIGALIVVTTRSNVVRSKVERAPASVGARPPMRVEREHESRERLDEHALYLVPRGDHGAPTRRPWVLRQSTAQYLSLGPRMRPTRPENFAVIVHVLRERAPRAKFDDRFAVHPRTTSDGIHVHGNATVAAPSDAGTDLAVHLLARSLQAASGGVFRSVT